MGGQVESIAEFVGQLDRSAEEVGLPGGSLHGLSRHPDASTSGAPEIQGH